MTSILIIKYHLFIVLIPYKKIKHIVLKNLHNLAIKNATSL